MIDQWVVCQATWMYLEPIFSSEDIIKQVSEGESEITFMLESFSNKLTSTRSLARLAVLAVLQSCVLV
jgi:dynein heavy chain